MPHPTDPSLKLHPLLVRAVAQALVAIFEEKGHADKVLESALRKNPKAGSRDRAFIAETTYEIVRYFRRYTEIAGGIPHTEADFWKIIGIHLLCSPKALYSEEEAKQPLFKRVGGGTPATERQEALLPDWDEFRSLNPRDIRDKADRLTADRRIWESIPDWLDDRGALELGERWADTLHWLNQPAQVVLRANRLKTDRAALKSVLQSEGVDTREAGAADALVLERRKNVFHTQAFKKGLFEVQDFSSQLVAPLLAPQPGMRVVDACAGGGGKTLHLAALMQGRGQIIALDTVGWKLDELRLRARRAGAANIETRLIESRKTIKRLFGSADRLLLDVPCSGLGVLRRNPDAKWKLSPRALEELRATQQDIIQGYSPILKPGGLMVYATCSILPSENERQVQTFLDSEAGKSFILLDEKHILPQDNGFDGFYMALLRRREE